MHVASCVWQEKAAGSATVTWSSSAGAGEWAAAMRVSAAALLAAAGGALNCAVSFVVFSLLDVLDAALCVAYKLADYAVEAEWKACYCAAAGPKVVRRLSLSKVQLEDVSDTLYVRPSLLADAATKKSAAAPSLAVVSPATAETTRGKTGRAAPCWSDCDCKVCHAWSSEAPRSASHLYVHVQPPPPQASSGGGVVVEDVVFIHGFISSSVFWTETVFPAFSAAARGRYRMLAVDLLGFGRSPKPAESLYTLQEHVEMIERSVLRRYRLGSFHVVAHSLGSVLALALAVKYPVKSLTLLAPPYFPVPKEVPGGSATQYVMRRVAPRRVWPPIAFGASMACWYEHVSRTICLTICRHHRLWDRLFRFFTRDRMRTFLIEAFMCHTHNAAWHTLHNIICGSAARMDAYLDAVANNQLSCKVALFHGRDDELLPVECTLAAGARVPRARVTVYDRKDHITIVLGQEELFAAELESIWRSAAD